MARGGLKERGYVRLQDAPSLSRPGAGGIGSTAPRDAEREPKELRHEAYSLLEPGQVDLEKAGAISPAFFVDIC